jgi:hypothetical protein
MTIRKAWGRMINTVVCEPFNLVRAAHVAVNGPEVHRMFRLDRQLSNMIANHGANDLIGADIDGRK